jgi:ketosteroid isomerase-like protein
MSTAGRETRDRFEIHELRAAYSRAIDEEDYERAHDVFTDDALVKYRDRDVHGSEQVAEYWREEVEYAFSMHTVRMPEIDIRGDVATGRWYMLVFYVAPDGTDGQVMGWYEDEYERVDGEWRIAEMDMGIEHDTGGYHV